MNKYINRFSIGLAGATLGAGLLIGHAIAQRPKLDAQDYVDIRQLVDGYSRILENCTNNGNDYANMYTNDATFGVSSTWGSGVKVWFKGRDQLARAGGAGPNTLKVAVVRDPNDLNVVLIQAAAPAAAPK